ncbi:triose-phosphate isomerase [Larsenimonas salina]|uniref:triose-phosphate isomerase n=1 Tax=Larsenimonas salina TaxID=1295565 RepID=UPI0020736E2F|nr:triose-phosphate isomerase [Larsenimonas salina]MCM5705300.1 triose-phosphate isomerase [Larsenimonas salina]
MRIPLIAGNWKMNGSLALIEDFGNAFSRTSFLSSAIDIAVIPPFPYLANADEAFEGTPVQIGAQTLYGEASGAFTGAVSASMLKEFGVHYVLVGHSERRTLFKEDDAAILAQARAAIDEGIVPILCVGETLEERDENRFDDVVLGQLDAVMNGLSEEQRRQLVVAYEPVWAIGTGRTATPEQAQEVHASLRARLRHYDENLADNMRLLYGGSMKPANAQELLSQADIDGGLIGGASLKPDDFIAICHAAG